MTVLRAKVTSPCEIHSGRFLGRALPHPTSLIGLLYIVLHPRALGRATRTPTFRRERLRAGGGGAAAAATVLRVAVGFSLLRAFGYREIYQPVSGAGWDAIGAIARLWLPPTRRS